MSDPTKNADVVEVLCDSDQHPTIRKTVGWLARKHDTGDVIRVESPQRLPNGLRQFSPLDIRYQGATHAIRFRCRLCRGKRLDPQMNHETAKRVFVEIITEGRDTITLAELTAKLNGN